MARTVPLYNNTLITETPGQADCMAQLYEQIEADLLAITTGTGGGVQAAWTKVYDNGGLTNVTNGAQATGAERVYVSKGDTDINSSQGVGWEGDTRIYVRMQAFRNQWSAGNSPGGIYHPGIGFGLGQLWDSTGTAADFLGGSTPYNYYNIDSIPALGNGYNNTTGYNETDDIELYTIGNEYEFFAITRQQGIWGWVHWGQPARSFVSPSYSGFGFTTAALTAGSSVSVSIDRDTFSTLTEGQKVFIIDVDAPAMGGTSANAEVVTITGLATGSTVNGIQETDCVITTLANNYSKGAIIGWDPCPHVIAGEPGTGSGYSDWWHHTISSHGVQSVQTSGGNTPQNGGTAYLAGGNYIYNRAYDRTVMDGEHWYSNTGGFGPWTPGTGLYHGSRIYVYDSNVARGVFDCRSYWAEGSQTDGDIIRADGKNDQKWKVFPSLIARSDPNTASYTMLGIGSGPTVT